MGQKGGKETNKKKKRKKKRRRKKIKRKRKTRIDQKARGKSVINLIVMTQTPNLRP